MLFSIAFLSLVVCLVVVYNNSRGKLFALSILAFILKNVPCLFLTADFNLFSCEFDSSAFTVLYSTI